MQALFIHITSSDGKKAYLPANRLLRVETIPKSATVLMVFEGFQVQIKTIEGLEAEVADNFYRDLNNFSHECVYLNLKTNHITTIDF
jgi:hypothetical protein